MRTKKIVLTVEAPRGTFPLRHLEAYVQECLRQFPATSDMSPAEKSQLEQDLNTLTTTISGGTLTTTIEKTLSPTEDLADQLHEANARLVALRDIYDATGRLRVGADGRVPPDVEKLLRSVILGLG